MTALQQELTNRIQILSPESQKLLLMFIESISEEKKKSDIKKRIGVCKGEHFIAEGYDFDEANDEIAEMFGEEQ